MMVGGGGTDAGPAGVARPRVVRNDESSEVTNFLLMDKFCSDGKELNSLIARAVKKSNFDTIFAFEGVKV